jgi:hypothetical protein
MSSSEPRRRALDDLTSGACRRRQLAHDRGDVGLAQSLGHTVGALANGCRRADIE